MLNPDYREMLSALKNANVEFVIVGAFALAAHGNPRSTGDIDIYVRPSAENASKIMTALRAFGAPLIDVDASDFVDLDTVLQIGVVPRRIDLLTGLDGIADFDEAWNSHVSAEIDGTSIPVLGRSTLIKNKRAIGRPQDLADIAWLEAHPE
ncbi:MAG: hypothetical protein E2O84_05600 [Bacteroidetes bacterium]|nr:MAG: hypothetical protein E2O84_05600 [Bacteroidota bacterium]